MENIIEEFLPGKIKDKKLIDFLHNLNPNKSADMSILSHWKGLFRQWRSPFILQEISPVLWKLWKEEKGEADYEL